MQSPGEPKRCPNCGGAVPAGSGLLLCAICALTGENDEEEITDDDPGGQRVGSYTLLGEIARGGMGVVYRARQDGLNRIVALRVLPGAAFASAAFRTRFQREAETAARLKHPGIVAVHEIGQATGQPFLSMDFIEGQSLAERLAESRMTPEFAAQLLCEVARAVDHAHHQGVAHRDLKPSNILLTPDNRPVLTDFGLACFLDLDANQGLTIDLMGSPPYLPPERVSPEKNDNPIMEDVYGLGAVLYHCLTGRPPFMADSLNALLAAVSNGEPVAPRRLNHSVPADLETICLKCLETAPSARYPSAAEVADELERFLRGDPIKARPLAPLDHFVRFLRRKPVLSALSFALLLSVVAGTAVSLWGWRNAAANARAARAMAEKRRVDLYSSDLAAAAAALESGNRPQVRHLLKECRPTTGESDLRGPEWFLLDHLVRQRELFSVEAHRHILTALDWSPSGKFLLSGAHDGTLRRWNLTDDSRLLLDEEILSAGNGRIQQVRWLPDERSFLVSEGGMIRCRRIGGKTALWEIPGCQFSLAADARTLAVSTGSPFYYDPPGVTSLWELSADVFQKPAVRRKFQQPSRAVAISPDAHWLAIGIPYREDTDDARGLMLLDISDPAAQPRTLDTAAGVWSLGFSPDSGRLAVTTTSSNGSVLLFDSASGREDTVSRNHTSIVWSATFAADSRTLLTSSSDRSLRSWPMDGGPPSILPLAHDNEIWTAAIHPSGTLVASGDKDGILKLHPWPLPEDLMETFPRHTHFRYELPVYTPDSSHLLLREASPSWKVVEWTPADDTRKVTGIPVMPLGIGADGAAVWIDFPLGKLFQQYPGKPQRVQDFMQESKAAYTDLHRANMSADGRFVFGISASGNAEVADLTTGAVRRVEGFCGGTPNASALSSGGRFLAAATWQDLFVHDFLTNKTTRLPNDPHWAKSIVFSPDCSFMATGGVDGHIMLRRLPDFTLITRLSGHLTEVSGLAISPDGRTLVSSEIGVGLRFWRIDTLHEVMTLALPTACETLVFAPDGQSIAVTVCPSATPPAKAEVLVIPCPRDGAE